MPLPARTNRLPLNRQQMSGTYRRGRAALPMAAQQANSSDWLDLSLFRYFILADR
jgi:hypothetical protein